MAPVPALALPPIGPAVRSDPGGTVSPGPCLDDAGPRYAACVRCTVLPFQARVLQAGPVEGIVVGRDTGGAACYQVPEPASLNSRNLRPSAAGPDGHCPVIGPLPPVGGHCLHVPPQAGGAHPVAHQLQYLRHRPLVPQWGQQVGGPGKASWCSGWVGTGTEVHNEVDMTTPL